MLPRIWRRPFWGLRRTPRLQDIGADEGHMPLKRLPRFRFSLWQMCVVVTLIALVFVRLHTTLSRRGAFERLCRQPCGFLTGSEEVFANPHDFLSLRGGSVISDFFFPPRITAICIRRPLDFDQRREVMQDISEFPELKTVYLNVDMTDEDLELWRSIMPSHVQVVRLRELREAVRSIRDFHLTVTRNRGY